MNTPKCALCGRPAVSWVEIRDYGQYYKYRWAYRCKFHTFIVIKFLKGRIRLKWI